MAECKPGLIEPPKAARGHATSYSARIDGIVLSVTKNNVSVREIACTVWLQTFDGKFSRGMAARKMSATDFGIETPSKRSELAQVLLLVRVPLLRIEGPAGF